MSMKSTNKLKITKKFKHYKQFCWHIEKSLIEFGIGYENFIVSTNINGNVDSSNSTSGKENQENTNNDKDKNSNKNIKTKARQTTKRKNRKMV